jgi:hypothetical protein
VTQPTDDAANRPPAPGEREFRRTLHDTVADAVVARDAPTTEQVPA